MNNEQRENFDELKLAEETLRVLDSHQFESDQDSRTYELGRLLKQSASHELPEHNDELREMLLAELEGESAVPAELSKTLAPVSKEVDRIGRRRMWLGLPAAAILIAVGGSWLYSTTGFMSVAEHDSKSELAELAARVEAAERQVYEEAMAAATTSKRTHLGSVKAENGAQDTPEYGSDSSIIRRQAVDPVEHLLRNEKQSDSQVKMLVKPAIIPQRGPQEVGSDRDGLENNEGKGFSSYRYEDPNVVTEGEAIAAGSAIDSKTGKSLFPYQFGVDADLPKLAELKKSSSVPVPDGETVLIGGNKRQGEKREQLGFALQQQSGQQQMQGQQKEEEGLRRGKKSSSRHKPKAVEFQPGVVQYTPQTGNGYFRGGQGGSGLGGGGGGIRRGESLSLGRKGKVASREDYLRGYDADGEKFEGFSESRESKSREQYAPIHENQFVRAVGGAAFSTFSIDVDTASYANMRRFLNSGQTPPRDSVRIEELVNYFEYDYPQPNGDDPFSVNMELATCPWNDTHKLLRVGLKGKEVHVQERPATNVVYLIDVSGSMNSQDKLPLLKRGFQMMTKQLGENDRVSIVTYAGSAGVALEPTTGDNTKTINEAIERLSPGGSTHGSAGIELAYKLAQQHFITGGVNKVILATDGDLNVGVTDDNSLVKLIKQKASEGVFLTVLGFGTGNLQDGKLEKLADNGNGHYAYLDSNREAHRVLVQQLSGSLVTIAKDVKIQIEFNPAEVKSYRLIGYENRMLATKDFADDRKDAGEIGAGHTVTAVYEIEPADSVAAAFTAPTGMKYQVAGAKVPQQSDGNALLKLSEAASSGELATLALRYKKPDENKSVRIDFTIKNDDKSFTNASDDFRFAASVAGFGMLLRGSEHAGTSTPEMILEIATESTGDDASGYRAEFLDLVRKACR